MSAPRSRIADAFARARAEGRAAFLPFVTAGDPDPRATVALADVLAEAGADVIEIGFPYSDPLADGPVIQASFGRALANGTRTTDVLALAREIRSAHPERPALVAMLSYALVYRRGTTRFVDEAAGVFDGVLVPDLPPEESDALGDHMDRVGLERIPLIAPTTPAERRARIAAWARGFVYYVSLTGTTGERDRLPPALAAGVAALRAETPLPIAVGFGIARPEQAATVARIADGVVVGSALVRAHHEGGTAAARELAAALAGALRHKDGPRP